MGSDSEFTRKGIAYARAENHACGITKDSIDAHAEKVAKYLELAPGGNVFEVIEQLGGRMHFRDPFEAEDYHDTIFVHGPGDFDIVLSTLTSARRDRFTAAHELGHYILHSSLGKQPLIAARRGTGRSEWEANWFAAGLLMPRSEFIEQSKRGLTEPLLADFFDVSLAAAQVRAKSLGTVKATQ